MAHSCPECGGPRGDVYPALSYDGSRRLDVTCWDNQCGHIDMYNDIRQEYFESKTTKQ